MHVVGDVHEIFVALQVNEAAECLLLLLLLLLLLAVVLFCVSFSPTCARSIMALTTERATWVACACAGGRWGRGGRHDAREQACCSCVRAGK